MSLVNHPNLLNSGVVIRFIQEPNSIRVEIETPRLLIRSYQDRDFPESIKLYSDSEITKYFDSGDPKSSKEVEELVESYKSISEHGILGLFSVFKKDEMTFIGHCDLAPSDKNGVLEVGFILHKEFHSRGYCTEMIRAILFDYFSAVSKRGYRSKNNPILGVMATVHPNNISSEKVLQKVGMKFQRFLERFGNPRYEYSMHLS